MNYDDNVDDNNDDETKDEHNKRRQRKTVIKLNFYGTCCLFLFVCSFILLAASRIETTEKQRNFIFH